MDTSNRSDAPDFRSLFEAVPGLYLVLTPAFDIVAVSNAYLAATMTRREEIVGRGIFEVFPDNPADPAASGVRNLRTSLEAVVQSRAPDTMAVQKYDIRRPAAEGGGFEERFWSPVNSPVLASDGSLAYIIHRVEDVTDLVRLERVKTDFLANVSHEFRSPLTLLMGPLEQLLEVVPEPYRDMVQTAQRNSQRLLTLVNTLLDFARLEAGRADPGFQAVDLAAFTGQLADVFRAPATDAGLTFTSRCEALPEPVFVDPEMWEIIVWNLLSNALKFTTAGEVTLALRAVDGHAELAVSDTGCGIPGPEQPRVFERFHRVRGAKGRTRDGTGIGLALVAELVKLHHGRIALESTAGKGSTFRIQLPFGRDHLPRDQVRTDAAPPRMSRTTPAFVQELAQWNADSRPTAPRELAPRERERVLVVDDSADMRKYLTLILSSRWNVETQPDGEAAWASIRAQPPALVISDVMMPVLDGLALSARMRADPQTAAVPLLLLSARTGEGATVDGLEAGAQDYLAKPFAPRELIARVQAHLELAALRRRLAAAERWSEERVQAQRMAAMGKLAGEIAADFNNLLTVVNGVTDVVLADPALSAEHREQLADVRSCGERAATLARQLLAYSSKQILRLEPVHVNRVLAHMHEVLQDVGAIRVRFELTSETDLIRADAQQLEQAIRDLVANACDAMPEGGDLTISTESVTLSGDPHVKVSVSDTGVGMDEETRARLFEPFTVPRSPGRDAGVGLATVHGIVSQCDGHIRVESQPGAGTTIALYFPVAPAAAVPERRPAADPPAQARPYTVLVVDDDVGVRRFITGVLSARGHVLLSAGDGAEALDLVARHAAPVDLVVTDALMPRMSGHQLIRELRALHHNLKVLVVSGYADEILSEHSRDDPSTLFLAKPFSPQALAESVQELLTSKGGSR